MQKHFRAGYFSKLLFYISVPQRKTCSRGNRMHLSRYITVIRLSATKRVTRNLPRPILHIPYTRENKAARLPGECVRAS